MGSAAGEWVDLFSCQSWFVRVISTHLQSEIMREYSCSALESIRFRALAADIELEFVEAHRDESREGLG